jgi:hypothetical protein
MTDASSLRTSTCRPLFLLVGLAALLVVNGCGSKPQPPPGICFAKRMRPNQPVEPGEYLRLMLQYHVTPNGDVQATNDCTGSPIHFNPPPENCVVKTPPLGDPHLVPITEESIMERMLPNDQRLVWIITHRFENGDGFGPVALIRIYPRGLAVDAIGPLRLRRERVGLELWKIGQEQVLMAMGETCFDKKDPNSCHRAANVLVYRSHAFLDPQISYTDGRCIDVPWVELSREADLPLPEGWNRHFEISSSLAHDERYLVITEQVEVNDSDPDEPDTPSREVRRIDTDRFIHVENGRLVTRQNPLWPKVLPTVGETDVTDKSKL